MNRVMLFACALAAIGGSGCSQRPPTFEEVQSPQAQLIAPQHWRVLADRLVTKMICEVDEADANKATRCRNDQPVYLVSTASDMPFSHAFRGYLTRALYERSIPVSNSPVNAMILKYHVQTFLLDPRTGTQYPFNKETFWTTLASLGWAAAEIGMSTGAGIITLATAGPVLDYLKSQGNTPNGEIILTAALQERGAISDLYIEEFYVPSRDVLPGGVYWSNFPAEPFTQQPLQVGRPPPPQIIRVSNN